MERIRRAKIRDEAGYQRFLEYIREAGFEPTVRTICLAHGVTPRDTYLDVRGPTVHAARLVLWWWLNESFGKSASEIARIYDRDHTSVNESVKKLRNRGIALGTPIQTIERANEVAKIMSMETMETLQRVGRQLAVHGTLSRKKVQPDGDS